MTQNEFRRTDRPKAAKKCRSLSMNIDFDGCIYIAQYGVSFILSHSFHTMMYTKLTIMPYGVDSTAQCAKLSAFYTSMYPANRAQKPIIILKFIFDFVSCSESHLDIRKRGSKFQRSCTKVS